MLVPLPFSRRPVARYRRAMTLMELMLVLAVLVVIAAIASPALTGSMEGQRLKSAAQQVQAIWTRAQVRAMRTGQTQVFHCELGTEKYEIIPWTADLNADEQEAANSPQAKQFATKSAASSLPPDEQPPHLPEGIQFLMADTLAEDRAAAIEAALIQQSSRQVQWSRPVMFYPDGQTSDAFLVLQNKREKAIRLELRGMTGSVAVGQITSATEATQ